jgi:hypothetical protein
VEQDPLEMLSTVVACIDETCAKLEKLNVDPQDIKAIGGHVFSIRLPIILFRIRIFNYIISGVACTFLLLRYTDSDSATEIRNSSGCVRQGCFRIYWRC